MKPLNIALIGAGRFGINHIRVLKSLEKTGICKLVLVADIRDDALFKVKEKYPSINTTSNIEKIADIPSIDVVDIVTPASTHYYIAKLFIKSNKHVFVEKPFTLNYLHAKELVNIAKKKGLHIGVGHIFRYNEALHNIKKLLDSGLVGDIRYLSGKFMDFKSPRGDVGVVFNFSVHFLDIFDFLLNRMPLKIHSIVSYLLERDEYEDYVFITLEYPGNIFGYIESTWYYIPYKIRRLVIAGTKSIIEADLLNQKYTIYNAYMKEKDGVFYAIKKEYKEYSTNFKEPLVLELKDFLSAVIKDVEPASNGEVASRIVYLAEKVLKSGGERAWVKLYEEK